MTWLFTPWMLLPVALACLYLVVCWRCWGSSRQCRHIRRRVTDLRQRQIDRIIERQEVQR